MSMRALRAAVVGTGAIGRQHANAIALSEGLELVALVNRGREPALALAETAKTWGSARPGVYSSLDDAFAAEDIDVVGIATPSATHADLAERALARGAHVLVEKPLDVSLARARGLAAVVERAAARGLVASVVSQHRFDPSSLAVRAAVTDGRLGRITSGLASVAWWRSQRYYDANPWRGTWRMDGGGAVMNQSIHTIDLLVWFLGTPVEVSATTATLAHPGLEVEDTAVATVVFESGALATVHATTAAYPGLTARLQIMGTRGSAVIDQDELVYFHAAGEGDDAPDMGLDGRGDQTGTLDGLVRAAGPHLDPTLTPEGHVRQYADLREAIASGRPPTTPVRDAVTVLATVGAVYASSVARRPVRVEDVIAGRYDGVLPPSGRADG